MARKFGYTYLLKCATKSESDEHVEIEPPFTLEFNIMRSINGSANTGSFTIYNLNPTTRKQLYKDPFFLEYRAVQLYAGYDDGEQKMLPLLFNGFMNTGSSVRQGVDFHTAIEAYDGALAMTEGMNNQTLAAGQTLGDNLLGMMKKLPGIVGATIGAGFDQKTQRGETVFGNPVEYLKTVSRNRFFIDNNHAYILKDDEILPGDIGAIDASTGLIGTPKKNSKILEVELIFEPRVTICQALELTSTTFPEANGTYRVIEINHSGMISPQVASRVTTKLKLQIPEESKLLRLVK
jgi:hypothetical protein